MQTFGLRKTVRVGSEVTGDLFERILGFLCENLGAEAWRGVFRSEVLEQSGYLEEAHGTAADQVWLMRLAVLGELVRVPEILYRRRLHPRSVVATARTRKGAAADSHWADHCVACHHIASAAGPWTEAQKQAIAAACLLRAVATPAGSLASLLATATDYTQRLSGLVPPGSDLMTQTSVPATSNRYLQRRLRRVAVNHALRMFLPNQALRDRVHGAATVCA